MQISYLNTDPAGTMKVEPDNCTPAWVAKAQAHAAQVRISPEEATALMLPQFQALASEGGMQLNAVSAALIFEPLDVEQVQMPETIWWVSAVFSTPPAYEGGVDAATGEQITPLKRQE